MSYLLVKLFNNNKTFDKYGKLDAQSLKMQGCNQGKFLQSQETFQ